MGSIFATAAAFDPRNTNRKLRSADAPSNFAVGQRFAISVRFTPTPYAAKKRLLIITLLNLHAFILTKNYSESASIAPNNVNRTNVTDPRNDPDCARWNVCVGIVHPY